VPAYAALRENYVEGDRLESASYRSSCSSLPGAHPLSTPARCASGESSRFAFAIFALGPFLTIGGFDTGLKLPEILLRYVPFVANARMPGRAMVGVFMALGPLAAVALSSATGRLRSPLVQWLLIGLLAFEYWDAPIRLTPLDHPSAYRALAAAAPGAVCEVPFGIGDGLSVGVGFAGAGRLVPCDAARAPAGRGVHREDAGRCRRALPAISG